MDKLPKGERKITVKINGEEKRFHEDLIIHNWQTKREMAVAKEEKTWGKPFEIKKRPMRKRFLFKGKVPNIYASNRHLSPPMLVFSILAAVGIGLLIGFLLLKVMVKDAGGTETTETTAPPVHENVGSEQMVLPAQPLFFLQQGVYQNGESVHRLVEELKGRNLPVASIRDGENYRVFVAVIKDVEMGKRMIGMPFYRDGYGETWPKQLEGKEKIIQNLTGDEKQFLESAYSLFAKLVEEGTKAFIQGEKYAGVTGEIEGDLEKLRSLSDFKQEPIKQLHQSLLDGYEGMNRFFETLDNADWKRAQSHLLEFAVGFYSL